MEHFANRFKEPKKNRPFFRSQLFRKLNCEKAAMLESEFSIDEIKDAVWNCSGSKAPRPDGFNFNFIKNYWDTIKTDFYNCIAYFHSTGKISKGCNASFIVMVPKIADPLDVSDSPRLASLVASIRLFPNFSQVD